MTSRKYRDYLHCPLTWVIMCNNPFWYFLQQFSIKGTITKLFHSVFFFQVNQQIRKFLRMIFKMINTHRFDNSRVHTYAASLYISVHHTFVLIFLLLPHMQIQSDQDSLLLLVLHQIITALVVIICILELLEPDLHIH